MSQLVGLRCTRCNERIKTVQDGTLCSACGSPVHPHCMSPGGVGCGACGTSPDVAAAYRESAQDEAEARNRTLRAYHSAWGFVYVCGGLGLIALGVVSIVAAVKGTGDWVVIWYGAVFVGAGLLVRGFNHFLVGRRRL